MKKPIFILAVTVFMAGSMLTNFQSLALKSQTARDKLLETKNYVIKAHINLNKIQHDSFTEYQKFKKEYEEKIIAYEKNITDFKAKIAKEKNDNKAKDQKKLAEIEQKTRDMKKKLENYKEEGKDKWEIFKTKFSHDMDDLGKDFKNLSD